MKKEEYKVKPTTFACNELEIGKDMILGDHRDADICSTRRVICCFLRFLGWSYHRIGTSLLRSHNSIMGSVKKATSFEILVSTYLLKTWKELNNEGEKKNEDDRN